MVVLFFLRCFFFFFFFNDTATTEIYTLSLHDALPISSHCGASLLGAARRCAHVRAKRSEEHTSELQSRGHLVCRLLLEKKKTTGTRLMTSDSTRTCPPSQATLCQT